MLMGATLGIAKFQGLESRDGMRRRFLPYLSSRLARTIYRPESIDDRMFTDFCMDLSLLDRLRGEIDFDQSGNDAWKIVQDSNREKLAKLPDLQDESTQALASLLASEPMHVLKIAMIFGCCRHISVSSANSAGVLLGGELISLAHKLVENCILSASELDTLSDVAYVEDAAEKVYDRVKEKPDVFEYLENSGNTYTLIATKSQLTTMFAHDTRRGSMTTNKLYDEVMPKLVDQGKCTKLKPSGRTQRWAFHFDR